MISQLRLICEHLAIERDPHEALGGLAMRISTSGRPVRIYVGGLTDGVLTRPLLASGFETEEGLIAAYESRFLPRILGEVIDADGLHLLTHDDHYRSQFEQLVGFKEARRWKSTIVLTILPTFIVALSTQFRVVDSPKNRDYYLTLKAILRLYLNANGRLLQLGPQQRRTSRVSVPGPRLTERQALILTLIEAGRTNLEIADKLGYSESLIRQETIAIYKKLGIHGRRDLAIEK